MTLQEKLDARREVGVAKFPADIVETMDRGHRDLRESGIMETALKVGQTAPSFSLKNQDGELIDSAKLLEKGSLVVTFYRGFW